MTIRHITLAATLLTAIASAPVATASLNPYLRIASREAKVRSHNPGSRSGDAENSPTYIPVIIKLAESDGVLPDFVNELNRRDNLVLATVEENRLNELADYRIVSRAESHMSSLPQMDKAKNFCGLPEILNSSADLPALTGKGVVVGFCDTGFWPGHINFRSSNGEMRVKRLVDYKLESAWPTVADTPDEIALWSTDSPDETHATHVAGILAGSYNADGYGGVAPEADIVATTSPLYDAYLLDGCEQVIDYAESQGKPAVINMSISSTTGAHDGTSLFNRYMERLTDDATVCIAASNDGSRKCYISHTFTDKTPTIRTYPRQYPSLSPLTARGAIDIWSCDERKFTISLAGWNLPTQSVSHRWECEAALEKGEMLVICSPDLAEEYPDHAEPLLPERFSGYIYVVSELNPENGRYNAMVYYNITDITTTDHYAAETMFGPEITAPEGVSVEIYSSSAIMLTTSTDPLGKAGDPSRSINDLCTGRGPVSVGSLTSRIYVPAIEGGEVAPVSKNTIGTPSYFTSYGTLNDGTVLPHFCAPGAQVVSSLSNAYLTAHPEAFPKQIAFAKEIDGEKYYWGSDQGTSMASPFAAGVMALWLQANPDLTPAQVREIAISTVSKPELQPGNPQWGGGVLDAAAGLKAARDLASITTPISETSTDSQVLVRNLGNRIFAIDCTSGKIATVSLRDMAGRQVWHADGEAFTGTASLGHLSGAIYIIEAQTSTGHRLTYKLFLH